jgi:hypothetical protein
LRTEVSEASGAADAVEVGLGRAREVKVDHDVDRRDVDTAREEIRRDKVAAGAVAEVVEDAVAVRLEHLGVDVEAAVAQLGDLLGEQLHAVDRVAKDDRLKRADGETRAPHARRRA